MYRVVDFAVPANLKVKGSEKIGKMEVFVKRIKKMLNMTTTVIPIVFDVIGTVPNGLEKRMWKLEISGRIETIQTVKIS